MKRALALVCSLMFVWTQIVLAQAPTCGVKPAPRACCHHGCQQASCCAAKNLPESQSAPAAPVSSDSQNQLSPLITATLIWTLPDNAACEFAPSASPFILTAGAPLYERNCTLLI